MLAEVVTQTVRKFSVFKSTTLKSSSLKPEVELVLSSKSSQSSESGKLIVRKDTLYVLIRPERSLSVAKGIVTVGRQ